VVSSTGPERVSVTLYRDPQRGTDGAFNLAWLRGFALVTETRTVTLPVGESEIRFEGVAGGIIPQSAIVTGFPDGVVERNRDAYLLSPATLLARSLGQRVMLRRTSHATGAVTETEAVIRSGADGAVVLQTPQGNEALRCTGQTETLVYQALPAGLSARPTLSVRTRAGRPVTATVTLAYLADGFDWQANYIATLSPDGRHVDLLAWLTLGSSDETSFINANAQAVAGQLNREAVEQQPREGGPLTLQCWPAATTSDIPLEELRRLALGRGRFLEGRGEDIVVTANRRSAGMVDMPLAVTAVMTAQLEALGDLKLYRIPEPVTLAARSQKQVAFMNRQRVAVRFAYRQGFAASDAFYRREGGPTRFMLTRNREAEGLGEPLPAGGLALFGAGPDRQILLGEGSVADRAVGEDVEVQLGPSPGVMSRFRVLRRQGDIGYFELVVTNDHPQPVAFEGALYFDQVRANARLDRRNGRPLWRVNVPANGRVILCFNTAVPEYARTPVPPVTAANCPTPQR
jgi:hypothetical protein